MFKILDIIFYSCGHVQKKINLLEITKNTEQQQQQRKILHTPRLINLS